MPFIVDTTNRFIRQTFSSLEYLGPLRAPAQRYYSVQEDTRSSELDAAGEQLPFVLQNMASIAVMNVEPGKVVPKEQTLEKSLNAWLHYLRDGSYDSSTKNGELRIKEIRGVLLEAELTSVLGREKHALADSGFGYSQVLPIIAKTLIASPGSTTLIEQPELHLNPALQVRLADFFIAMALAGKQVIVETHSEHLINALRTAAAEDATERIAPLISVYYLDSLGPKPDILKLEVQSDGTVPDWPPDFFGDALRLSTRLLKAQSAKRKARHGKAS
jgi:predicted ATPase